MRYRDLFARDEEHNLNLAPILNVVMILIPLMLINATFLVVATLSTSSPSPPNVSETPPEEVAPRLLIAITEDGFTIGDLRQTSTFIESGLGLPIPGCEAHALVSDGVPATVCARDVRSDSSLMARLDYRGLYNRLVEIRERWADHWHDSAISITADREIPADAVIRAMDVSRFLLEESFYGDDEAFRVAQYRLNEGQPIALFEAPVLMLPRAQAQ